MPIVSIPRAFELYRQLALELPTWVVQKDSPLRPRQNGRHFPDDIFKVIFFYENCYISIEISLKFVPQGPIILINPIFQGWFR